jgi:HAD superfamily hydrolase (TIGR01509 family)
MTDRPLAVDGVDEFMRRTLARFRAHLKPIAGVHEYLASIDGLRRCVASSSPPERLAVCLDVIGLAGHFGAHVYSASVVPRGKPHPDLFLHAVAQFGVAPADAVVIEDSEIGVRAGIAAGMTTIGFLGASHIRDGDEARLRRAGAHHIARTYADVERITHGLVRGS